MKNFEKLLYSYKHRKVLCFLANKYYGDNKKLLEKIKYHDLDKMYLLLFYDKKDIDPIHKKLAFHHDNAIPKTKLDYIEMVLDWESARYTKEDKPLNAYDTLYKFYPQLEDEILPILQKLKINKSTFDKDEDVISYQSTLSNITEKDIKTELINFIEQL